MAEELALSIVVPCFNEAKRLPVKFPGAYQYFQRNFRSFEIILVNDGSADETEKVIRKIAGTYNQVKIVSYQKNRGKGYALKHGVLKSTGKIVAFMDADFAITVSESDKFIKAINNGADIAIGNRRSSESEKLNSPQYLRVFLGNLLSYINNFFLDIGGIKDSQCGFKFFKGEVARELFRKLTINRWLFDLELLMLAKKIGYKVVRLPVAWETTTDSKVSLQNDFIPVARDLIKIYFQFYSWKLHTLITLALLIIITLPFLISPQSLVTRNGDYTDLVMPDYYLFKESVYRHQQIPLWNPTLFSGIPEIANPQSPIIYPPNYLTLILPVELSIILLVIAHALLSGVFLFLLSRKVLGWSILSSVIVSYVFTFSPFIWGKVAVGHLSQSFAIFLLAPILYFGSKLYVQFTKKGLLALIFFLALQYLNYPTIWYFTVLFGGFAFISLSYWAGKKVAYFLLPLLAAGLSLMIILPVFFVQLRAGPLITRSILDFSDLAIPLWSLKRFISSILIPSNLLGDGETEVWLYPSLLVIGAAILGWLKMLRKFQFITGAILMTVILISLGNRTPLFQFLTAYFPGFSYLRVATRDWFILIALLAILAGWGISQMSGKWQKLLAGMILLDLIIFSAFRLWSVPEIMTTRINGQLESFLSQDMRYRYYCTSRCLSALYTLPKGITTADGYHLMILKSYREAISRAGGFLPPKYTGNIPSTDDLAAQPSAEELGKFAVKWVISDHQLNDNNFEKFDQVKGFILYQNLSALPRFRILGNPAQKINLLTDSPNYLRIHTSGSGGTLLVADSFYPGWEAKIDNKTTTIYLEDGWARAILVPSGDHIIELEFKPLSNILN